MIVKQFNVGGDRNFAYVVYDEKSRQAFIVDPSYSPDKLIKFVQDQDLKIIYVFNTHRHHDHTNGNDIVYDRIGIKAIAYLDKEPETNIRLIQNAELPFADFTIKILYTPGHTDDSICILAKDALFTGDTLFVGKVGGTDFGENAKKEYDSLHQIIANLPGETRVYSGHDVGLTPVSTIGEELKTNPFYLQESFEEFVDLKRNWLEYKKKHGIE